MLDRVMLDASVVVSAFSPNEEAAKDSRHLLELLLRDRVVIVVPTLIRPEIVAAIRRATGDPGKAKVFEESFSRLPGVVFQELDDRIADAAVEIVAGAGLRGPMPCMQRPHAVSKPHWSLSMRNNGHDSRPASRPSIRQRPSPCCRPGGCSSHLSGQRCARVGRSPRTPGRAGRDSAARLDATQARAVHISSVLTTLYWTSIPPRSK